MQELSNNKRQSAMGVVTHSNYYIKDNLAAQNQKKGAQRDASESTVPAEPTQVQVQIVDDYQSKKHAFMHKKSINNNYYANNNKDAVSQRS